MTCIGGRGRIIPLLSWKPTLTDGMWVAQPLTPLPVSVGTM